MEQLIGVKSHFAKTSRANCQAAFAMDAASAKGYVGIEHAGIRATKQLWERAREKLA